jgi:hypothetical protein
VQDFRSKERGCVSRHHHYHVVACYEWLHQPSHPLSRTATFASVKFVSPSTLLPTRPPTFSSSIASLLQRPHNLCSILCQPRLPSQPLCMNRTVPLISQAQPNNCNVLCCDSIVYHNFPRLHQFSPFTNLQNTQCCRVEAVHC